MTAQHHTPNTCNGCNCHADRPNSGQTAWQAFLPAAISLLLLALGLFFDHWQPQPWFSGVWRLTWYIAAYIPVAFGVLREAVESIIGGDIFSEFFLMGIATLGAFAIGEYPEAVAVMLFYSIGEAFQDMAVQRARANIAALLDQRPDEVTILKDGQLLTTKATEVQPGDVILLKAGEKLALDGILLSAASAFDTAALTGESKPDTKRQGDIVLAGMLNLNGVCQVQVTTPYADSKLSKILALVQYAAEQKAPTERFIHKFAKVYTPIVVALAVSITILPYFIVSHYDFATWLYRALVFLVISCPCALVISIPLGYFGGIGAGSKHGILFKGGQYLDAMAQVSHIIMDKTGTLTEGVFRVQDIVMCNGFEARDLMPMVAALEAQTTHPIATAILHHMGNVQQPEVDGVEELPGFGLTATVAGRSLLVGNARLMDKFGIHYRDLLPDTPYTTVAVAYGGVFAGYITIADSLKGDARDAVRQLHRLHVKTTMLSGDKTAVVRHVADALGIGQAYGDLLPEDKVTKFKEVKAAEKCTAFVGDGINDAPVLALSDVGVAMGGLGSDAAIETADVVIQDDKPSKLATAIRIGQATKRIVWQNIALAFGIKGAVLLLGAGGLATMWEAVFADVGVALIAVLNAMRIQYKRF